MLHPFPPSEPLDWVALDDTLGCLLQEVQAQVLTPPQLGTALTPLYQAIQSDAPPSLLAAEAALEQRHRTEIHRLLRLLFTDVAFYQAARSTTLQQQRLAQLGDRLLQLRHHTQAMGQLIQSKEPLG